MKIAIISDSHDHVQNLKDILSAIKETDLLIHCGDLVAPFMIQELGHNYTRPIHIIWGNVQGDLPLTRENAKGYSQIAIDGEEAHLNIGGRQIAATHFPARANELAELGQYDLVCFGHTHKAETRRIGKTLLVNPGDVMGRFDAKAHYAVYDSATGGVELKALDAHPA
jgi:putative phosphoesterase